MLARSGLISSLFCLSPPPHSILLPLPFHLAFLSRLPFLIKQPCSLLHNSLNVSTMCSICSKLRSSDVDSFKVERKTNKQKKLLYEDVRLQKKTVVFSKSLASIPMDWIANANQSYHRWHISGNRWETKLEFADWMERAASLRLM